MGTSETNCPRNVNIGLLGIDSNSATIKWVETQGFASNFEYGEKGFQLGSGTKGSTNDESIVLGDLKPDTEYEFYLQSICTAEIQGNFITNPYTFKTLPCFDLKQDDISIVGYVKNGGFRVNWYPKRNAEEWQVAMIAEDVDKPTDSNISTVEARPSQGSFVFPEINPSSRYNFFIRGQCNGNLGDWVTKEINPADESLFSPCLIRVQNLAVTGESISFSVLTSGTVEVIVVEKDTMIDSGFLLSNNGNDLSYFIDLRYFHNNYSNYVKPNTQYNVLARLKCGLSYSEEVMVSSFKTPLANSAYFIQHVVEEDELQLYWQGGYGFSNSFCWAYDEVVYEIEYGLEGFTAGEGTSIITEGIASGVNFIYALPLNLLNSGFTYEFSIRSIVNGSYPSEWNSNHCNNSGIGRLVFTAP
ncbi:MAG: fibronectin type III domain-containing protein [Bacteroidota bacterium]